MLIDGISLPEPVEIETNDVPVRVHNVAHGGVKSQIMYTGPDETHLIGLSLQWMDLTESQLADLMDALEAAAQGYVTLSMDNLNAYVGGAYHDMISVTLMPQGGYEIVYQQAYTTDGDGPLLYDVRAGFVSAPIAL